MTDEQLNALVERLEAATQNGAWPGIAAAASAIRQLMREREWQPIDTAPRDGTWVMIAGGEPDDEDWNLNVAPCVVARWTGSFWDYGHYAHDDGELEWKRPTHWMSIKHPLTPS